MADGSIDYPFLLMANYENIKNSVGQNGEIIIRLVITENIGLHKHNIKFDDN